MSIKNLLLKHIKGPDISVIIPFYNVEKYISECLESLLAQKGITLEVILVDDGSTDKSVDIVKEYMVQYDNLTLYHTNQKGPGYARNYGVRYAKGEYIAFLDADDILVQGIYRRMLRSARNNDAEVCICNAVRFNSKRIWSSDLHDRVYKNYRCCTHINNNPTLIYDSCVWNKLINRKFYVRNKIKCPEGVYYEDILFNAEIHAKCNKVIMLAETGYYWRAREEDEEASISQAYYEEKNINDRFTAVKELIDYFDDRKYPPELREIAEFRALERDFKIVLDSVNHMDVIESMKLLQRVQKFISNNIDRSTMEQLSIVDIQRYENVNKNNLDDYKKILAYRKKDYNNASIQDSGDDLIAVLPEDLITISKRSVIDEFSRKTRRTWVDEITFKEDDIVISAHSYIHRYNISGVEDQKISVYLINEETNDIIEVPSSNRETGFLTERFGSVYDEYTDTYTNYNYDYTGFAFKLKDALDSCVLKYKKTKYSVVIGYKDRYFEGSQIIKGVDENRIDKYEKKRLRLADRRIRVKFGVQKELQIIVDKIIE